LHDQRDRRARVLLRELPRRTRCGPEPRLRDRLPLLRRHDHAVDSRRGRARMGEPARLVSRGACFPRGTPTHHPTAIVSEKNARVGDESATTSHAAARADVSAVVVTFNALPWLEQCLASLAGYDTVVVDHGSTDGTLALVRERFPDVRVVEQEN